MTTASPLSLPFVLDQKQPAASSHAHRRRWKLDRPNYRALLSAHHDEIISGKVVSRNISAAKDSISQHDPDQLEADLQEWGLPPASSSSQLAVPTSAISWDENSAQASCSYLQNQRTSSSIAAASLDLWDPSISFAPYSSSGLAPISLGSGASIEPGSSPRPFRYDSSLGRVIAVGRDDGTVTIYRAHGRLEDYESLPSKDQQSGQADDSLPTSASASVNLSHASRPASARSSIITSPTRLRSPEAATPSIRLPSSAASHSTTSVGREPSPLMAAFSPLDRSSAARSTVSAASAHSTVAAAVQLDEGLPANSLQSNVNATGHTTGRNYGDEAENRLEQQMAAAERNDHQHGVVGGVIERLGFSSHAHSQSQFHSQSSSSHHQPLKAPSRQSPVTPPRASPSIDSLAATYAQAKGQGSPTPERHDASLPPSESDAWLHDPDRGSFSQVMTFYTRDWSPVVALRMIPLSTTTERNDSTSSPTATLAPEDVVLVVAQEAGTISSWSMLEGTMLWQSDLTTAHVAVGTVDSTEPSMKENSATLGVMHSLGRFPSAIGTPRTRSPAGSARASPKPTLLAGDAGLRRSLLRTALSAPDSEISSRLREIRGVKVGDTMQTFDLHGVSVALIWDSHSSSVFMLNLMDGGLLLRETLDDVLPASTPTLCMTPESKERMQLFWFSETDRKLQKQLVRIVTSGAATQGDASERPELFRGIVFDRTTEAQHSSDEAWTLPDQAGQAQKVYVLQDFILVLGSERLSVLDSTSGQMQFTQEAGAGQFKRVCGSSRGSQHLLVQSSSGLSRLNLSAAPAGSSAEYGSRKASLTPLASPPPSRLSLAWNLPSLGDLLDKLLLFQPLSSDGVVASASNRRRELEAFDMTNSQCEDLLSSRGSDPVAPSTSDADTGDRGRITAVLPLSLERIAIAIEGGIRILPLSSIAAQDDGAALSRDIRNNLGPDHEICLLRSAVAPRSGQRLIVGGTLQGEVGFWNANTAATSDNASTSTPQLEAMLSVSTTPVQALLVFGDDDNTIRLHGCLACICADSSVTIVLLESFRLQYTIPGRGARLTSLAVRADELLLTYDDEKARVWDLRTQELRRSIATDQAQALVEDGKGRWTVKPIEPNSPLHSGTTGVLSQLASARDDAAASLLVDFRRAIEAAARSVRGTTQSGAKEDAPLAVSRGDAPAAAGSQPPTALKSEQENDQNGALASVGLGSMAARKAINIARPLLPTVFPTGLDGVIDAKLAALLDLETPRGASVGQSVLTVGLHSAPDALMVGKTDARSAERTADVDCKRAWKLSHRLTTMRLLVASALLRILSHVSELKHLAEDLQHFVENEANLSSLVGVGFRGVQLTELVLYWLDSNSELQDASRGMFQDAVTRLDQAQVDCLCDQWQGALSPAKTAQENAGIRIELVSPALTPEEAKLQIRALALLGSLAVERYTSLSPRLLKDIAKTIHGAITSDKVSETRSSHETQTLGVAIELCRNGFSMWQHYFDATEVVRSLFALSTSTSTFGNANTEGDLRTLARAATLQIAAENTPLFMTTLSLDILHARSAAHCSATMRLVAFMVRKRPSVLVASLPRLAEAVVKSLDPTHTTMREAVVHAATVMIGELVSTYPSVSFFGGGQRLAVGTHEGAVIMYDLKTATRLYVLEGHRRRADAVSFSPDGRRLVTMSLDEGRVLVWKTSSGFSAFFSPGQMPRQGASDVKLTDGAYKAFLFNVGDQQQGASKLGLPPSAAATTTGENQEQAFVGYDRIRFQWSSERSVKVHIGEAQLNISVD